MCGEHPATEPLQLSTVGSSPHVRGALGDDAGLPLHSGIIPACAGSTNCVIPPSQRRTGSSPHVRGALPKRVMANDFLGIIPACAGSTMPTHTGMNTGRDHPRMCGEHASCSLHRFPRQGSSPHVRGAHFENSIIPRKRKDNWLFFIQFRFENFLAFRYLLALLHPFLGVPTKDPSFASLGRLINCNPSQSTGDQSAPYTLKAICCSFLAE